MQPEDQVLFSPLQIRGITLRNRVVVPPMVQRRPHTSAEGVAWYRNMALGGAGLVIVESTNTSRFAHELTSQNLKPLVDAIHGAGAAAAIQLSMLAPHGTPAEPNAYTDDDIHNAKAAFVNAAHVCHEAGFDGVEPHGAHGFALNQFFMPTRNQRSDQYGGNLDNRCRLGVEVVEQIRQTVPQNMVILYRHSPEGDDYGIKDSLVMADRLVAAGVDILDISPARKDKPAALAAPFKDCCDVPVIAVGMLDQANDAAEALAENRCDLVAVGRGLIADPQWPLKVAEGRREDIVTCIRCNGCHGDLRQGRAVGCTQWA